jgi:hypothetical protein
MRASSAVRQLVTYPTHTTLLIVGVLLLASVTPLYAEPAATQAVNWFSSAYAAAPVPRSGFLLPTLAVPETAAAPRLMVTESAFLGAAPVRVSLAAGQDQTPPKPQRSWFGRNWWWVVPVAVVATWVIGVTVYCSSNPSMCSD